MKVKRILLTSDDGYKSSGLRLLIALLSGEFELKIAATETQQSSVGGKVSARDGGKWGVEKVDGVEALWVSGTPVDAVECGRVYYKRKFDLVISGINWGENVSGAILASGTFNAAAWSLTNGLTKQAMALSWRVSPEYWFHDHDGDGEVDEMLLENPGKAVRRVFDLALENNFWNSALLNINFPREMPKGIRFTRAAPDQTKIYKFTLDKKKMKYLYPPQYVKKQVSDIKYDWGGAKERLCFHYSLWKGYVGC